MLFLSNFCVDAIQRLIYTAIDPEKHFTIYSKTIVRLFSGNLIPRSSVWYILAPFICTNKSFKTIWKKFPKCNQLVSKCPKVLSQGGVELREGRNSLRLGRPCKLACSSPLLFFVTAVSWLSASMPLFCHNIRLWCWKLESFDISPVSRSTLVPLQLRLCLHWVQ